MTLLSVQGVSKAFGVYDVFAEVSLQINQGERVGLVGRNGAGKTTLLDVISGKQEPDEGFVSRGIDIGYLTQSITIESKEVTLGEYALESFAELRELEAELRELEKQMAESMVLQKVLNKYTLLTEEFEQNGGYLYQAEALKVLRGLGFAAVELDLSMSALSGGQRIRAKLAQLLLAKPELLILDEPTNHLDVDGREWLESYLSSYPGAILVVSHDRLFLDQVVTKMAELEHGRLRVYSGNYSNYIRDKRESISLQMKSYEAQQKEIARQERYINKFRAGTRSKQAKSREKMLNRVQRIEKPRTDEKRVRLQFASTSQLYKNVLQIEGLTKAFPSKVLFKDFSGGILRGERIALVGPNGSGKSTFVKILLGEIEPTAGGFQWGKSVKVGYLAQEHLGLVEDRTVLDEIREGYSFDIPKARSYLGRFLFSADDVFKKVGVLSGGEKTRLLLAKLVLEGANVLVLDEPTNNLDLVSIEQLEAALESFSGSIIMVSHDRYFIDRLTTKLWIMQDQRILVFKGGYLDYRKLLKEQVEKKEPKHRREKRNPELGRKEKELRELEEEISLLEAEKAKLEEVLVDPLMYGQETAVVGAKYEEISTRLESVYTGWTRIMDWLEKYRDTGGDKSE